VFIEFLFPFSGLGVAALVWFGSVPVGVSAIRRSMALAIRVPPRGGISTSRAFIPY
jgi:hypothetical protein